MAETPVVAGEIPQDGVAPLLGEIEAHRTTGVLRFESSDESGEVALVRGQIASEQPARADGRDPVEVLLELTGGRYEVLQRLPSLPVSRGDHHRRDGSLAVHVPADLMNYCEQVGLTGVLTLRKEARRAEMLYDKGELVGIQVDGSDDEDLREVFGWEEGSFEIEARDRTPSFEQAVSEETSDAEANPAFEERTTEPFRKRPEDTRRQFLRVVEVALSSVVSDRESYRPAARSSPAMPPLSAPRPPAVSLSPQAGAEPEPESHPASASPAHGSPESAAEADAEAEREAREPTVRIVYRTEQPESAGDDHGAAPPGTGSASGSGARSDDPDPEDETTVHRTHRTRGHEQPQTRDSEEEPMSPGEDQEQRPAAARQQGSHDDPPRDPADRQEPEGDVPAASAGSAMVALGWAIAVLLVMVAALAVLARLPSLT